MKSNKNYLSVVLSISAVVISIFTLYLSKLEPSKITVFTGEDVVIWSEVDIDRSISFPINFYNTGAELGVIEKIALVIYGPKRKGPYLVEAKYFLNSKNKNESPKPIMLPGHDNTLRQITFSGIEDVLKEGKGLYEIIVLIWKDDYDIPIKSDSFSIVVPQSDLDSFRNTYQSRTYVISNWANWKSGYITDPEIISKLPKH